MALTDLEVKNAKPGEKVYFLKDEHGLYLYVRPSGKKSWRMRYWIDGKENTVTLGEYPAIGLREARMMRDKAREYVSVGLKPAIKKFGQYEEERRKDNTFEEIAAEWLEIKRKEYVSVKSLQTLNSRVKQYLIPFLGHLAMDEITAPALLAIIKRIEATSPAST